MKIKITALILLAFVLSGCFATAGAVFGGLNMVYNGLQEYRELKKNAGEIKARRQIKKLSSLPLPPDPWKNLKHCSCDSGTYCLSDQDYISIIGYNEALKVDSKIN